MGIDCSRKRTHGWINGSGPDTKHVVDYLRQKNTWLRRGCPDWNNPSPKLDINISPMRDPSGDPMGIPMSGGSM